MNRLSVDGDSVLPTARNRLNNPGMALPRRVWVREVGEARLTLGQDKELIGI